MATWLTYCFRVGYQAPPRAAASLDRSFMRSTIGRSSTNSFSGEEDDVWLQRAGPVDECLEVAQRDVRPDPCEFRWWKYQRIGEVEIQRDEASPLVTTQRDQFPIADRAQLLLGNSSYTLAPEMRPHFACREHVHRALGEAPLLPVLLIGDDDPDWRGCRVRPGPVRRLLTPGEGSHSQRIVSPLHCLLVDHRHRGEGRVRTAIRFHLEAEQIQTGRHQRATPVGAIPGGRKATAAHGGNGHAGDSHA